jgi:Rrf2 family protein
MLSQTSEYALRAMIHLCGLAAKSSANSETIAARTKVPQGYLSKILRDLVLAELICSQRGPNGGFSLAKPPEEISLLDVINAVDPIRRITKCPLGNPAHTELCPLHRRIDDTMAMIETEFRGATLAEVNSVAVKNKGTCRILVNATVKGKPM